MRTTNGSVEKHSTLHVVGEMIHDRTGETDSTLAKLVEEAISNGTAFADIGKQLVSERKLRSDADTRRIALLTDQSFIELLRINIDELNAIQAHELAIKQANTSGLKYLGLAVVLLAVIALGAYWVQSQFQSNGYTRELNDARAEVSELVSQDMKKLELLDYMVLKDETSKHLFEAWTSETTNLGDNRFRAFQRVQKLLNSQQGRPAEDSQALRELSSWSQAIQHASDGNDGIKRVRLVIPDELLHQYIARRKSGKTPTLALLFLRTLSEYENESFGEVVELGKLIGDDELTSQKLIMLAHSHKRIGDIPGAQELLEKHADRFSDNPRHEYADLLTLKYMLQVENQTVSNAELEGLFEEAVETYRNVLGSEFGRIHSATIVEKLYAIMSSKLVRDNGKGLDHAIKFDNEFKGQLGSELNIQPASGLFYHKLSQLQLKSGVDSNEAMLFMAHAVARFELCPELCRNNIDYPQSHFMLGVWMAKTFFRDGDDRKRVLAIEHFKKADDLLASGRIDDAPPITISNQRKIIAQYLADSRINATVDSRVVPASYSEDVAPTILTE